MTFSIVIPAYNYGHLLPRAVESVLAQGGEDYQVVIIDDGSQDETPAVGRGLAEAHPHRVRYVRQQNQGPAAARNRGIDETAGQYLIFLDADDRLLDGALEKFRGYLAANGAKQMVTAGHISVHPDGRRKTHPAKSLSADRMENFRRYVQRRFGLSNGATIMAREIFQSIRYPVHIRNSEDIPVFAQALALYDCSSFAEPVLEIFKHDDSLRNNIELIMKTGTALIDVLFDPKVLPAEFMALRAEMFGRQCLSLSRSLSLAGRQVEARRYYLQGIAARPTLLLEWSYLRKFLRSFVKKEQPTV
ncbi:hypothetical protein DESUT3_22630 [Desulfuromonas versatilis]|uniref:Glycosyltransferase 2-like domain-containing protein n=1 Tax=Desulfuromonas versatilis TaxID=2802975 RepID=A0ABN6E148_9BACT|nr:glycosyltransferase family 2 protein [Desulfuromonas versatilis]BCR05194.1 hypothetical protein DESUT3_22630 [Desulfuromonas versatilis]